MTTPLGSAVAPEVKMISTTVSRVGVTGVGDAGEPPDGHGFADRAGRQVDLVPHQHHPRLDDAGDLAQEVGRGSIVDRDHDRAAQHRSPEADDPLRAVLAPDHDLVVGADPVPRQGSGKRLSGRRDLAIGPGSDPEPVVVDEEGARQAAEIGEEIEQGLARHRTFGGGGRGDETGLARR